MNNDQAAGILDQAKGKLKEVFGNATGDEHLANSGAADQVKGHVRETWGDVKDTATHLAGSARAASEEQETELRTDANDSSVSLRDEAVEEAEHLKSSIKRGLDRIEQEADRRR